MKEIPQLRNKTTKFSCNNNSSQLQFINNYMFDKLFTDCLTLASMVLLNEINVSIDISLMCGSLGDTSCTLQDGPT